MPVALLAALSILFAATAATADRHSIVPTFSSGVSFCPFDDFALHSTLDLPSPPSLPAPGAAPCPPKLSDSRCVLQAYHGVWLSRAPPNCPAVS